MDELIKFFHARKSAYHTSVRRFDEVIYTPYTYHPAKSQSVHFDTPNPGTGDLLGIPGLNAPDLGDDSNTTSPGDTHNPLTQQKLGRFRNQQPAGESEIFLFEYGVSILLQRVTG